MEELTEDHAIKLETLLDSGDSAGAILYLESLHAADAADVLEALDHEHLVATMERWDVEKAADVLRELEPEHRGLLARKLDSRTLADILDVMAADDAANFLEEIDPDTRARLIGRMERDEASEVAELLDFPDDSAGRRMSQDFFSAGEHTTADEVIDLMREVPQEVELVYYVYVLGGSGQLKGVVPTRRLITAAPQIPIGELMETDLVTVKPTDDVEAVAELVQRYDLLAVPVVDDFERMLGIVTVDDVLESLAEEAEADVLRFAGSVEEESGQPRVWSAFRRRLPWLVAATLIELLIAYFLLKPLRPDLLIVTIAYIPLLIFVGGNTAVQAAARVLVRLVSGRTEAWSPWVQARKELHAGFLLALIAGALTFPFLALLGRGWGLAAVVAPSVAITVVVGAGLGSTLPIILHRMRLDPAIASGPLLGSAMDIVSIWIYVSLAIRFARFIL